MQFRVSDQPVEEVKDGDDRVDLTKRIRESIGLEPKYCIMFPESAQS